MVYAFIHIPKTAGTTVRSLLRRSFGGRHCDVRMPKFHRRNRYWLEARDLALVKAVYPDLAGICGHRVCIFSDLGEALPGLEFCTFLRDPVKRSISRFHHLHRGRMDQCTVGNLERFAADPAERNMQTRWLCGKENAELAIRAVDSEIAVVGLTERFDESLLLLSRWLNAPWLDLRYVARNITPKMAPLPYFDDPYLRGLLQDANREDIILYTHTVERRFPTQIAAYGDSFESELKGFRQRQARFNDSAEPLWGVVKRNLVYKPLSHLPFV